MLLGALAFAALGCVNPSPYGVNLSYYAPTTPPAAYDFAVASGFGWVRVTAPWEVIEPNRGEFHWELIDGAITTARAHGLSIALTLQHPVPTWARGAADRDCGTSPKPAALPPANPAYFAELADSAARTFKGRVDSYELGSEVNGCWSFRGTPARYRQLMLNPGFDAIRAIDPTVRILPASLFNSADFDTWLTYAKNGQRFLSRPIDLYNIHLYDLPGQNVTRLSDAESWIGCSELLPYCVTRFWVTEFGYSDFKGGRGCTWSPPPDVGGAARDTLAACRSSGFCERSFYWNIIEDDPSCGWGLLDLSTVQLKPVYQKFIDWIRAHP